MGVCRQNCSPGPADIAAGWWTDLGGDRNDEKISAVQGENGSTFEAPPQKNLKHFQCLMS